MECSGLVPPPIPSTSCSLIGRSSVLSLECATHRTFCRSFEGFDQAAPADAVNAAEFFLTNSCTPRGACPVRVSTSSDIRS
jgi:hypothetical protein